MASPAIAPVRPGLAWTSAAFLAVATVVAPIFIRYAQGAGVPSLSIIVLRLILSSLIISPIALPHHGGEIRRLAKRDWVLAVFAGIFHALGLIFLFYGLEYTSILVNGVMRRTSPLWSIFLEMLFLGAVFRRNMWTGLGLSTVGTILVVIGTSGAIEPGSQPIFGAILSMGNAVTLAIYLIIGRSLRNNLSFLAYSWVLFVSAAVVSIIVAIVTNSPVLGFSWEGYFWTIMVALSAQIMGHLPAAYAIRYFSATYLAMLMQIGVVLSAIVGFFAFGEIPSLLQIIGSGLLLFGVYWVSRTS